MFSIPPTQTGMLSDISEAEESSLDEVSISRGTPPASVQMPALSVEGPKQDLSFASFGSSYPSSTPYRDAVTSPEAARSYCIRGGEEAIAEAVDDSSEYAPESQLQVVVMASDPVLPVTPSRSSHVEEQVQTPDNAVHTESQSDVVLTAELLSSLEAQAVSTTSQTPCAESLEGHKAIQASDTEQALCLQVSSSIPFPQAGSEKVSAPSPIVVESVEAGSPSTQRGYVPTPSESTSVPANVSAPSREEDKNPSSASAPVVPPTPYKRLRIGAPHTADRPNWALAPDEPAEPKPVRSRQSGGRGRGRGRRGRVTGSNAIPLGSRNRTQDGAAPEEHSSHAPQALASAAYVREKSEATQPSLVQQRSARALQDGPAQWLERIDSWLEESAQAPSSAIQHDTTSPCPTTSPAESLLPAASLTPKGSQGICSETSTGGLNPDASASSSQFTQTPFTFGAAPQTSPYASPEVERLRDMLRNSGVQDAANSSSGMFLVF